MGEVGVVILTIFGLIGIGYGAAKVRLLEPDTGEGLSDFVFTIAIPVLLFRTLADAHFGDVSPWGAWAVYFAGIIVVWTLGHVLVRRIFGRDARAGMIAGISASFANTVLVGVPLVETTYGEAGMVWLLVLLSVHLPVVMLASLLLNEWALRADGIVAGGIDRGALARRFVTNLARHPIVLGIVAGALWRALGLGLTGVLDELTGALARVAGPTALVASGLELARHGLARNVPQGLLVSVLKLGLMPLIVLAVGLALGIPPLANAVMVAIAACPTGINAFLFASRFGTGEALATNAMTISTAFAAPTMAGWLLVLRWLG